MASGWVRMLREGMTPLAAVTVAGDHADIAAGAGPTQYETNGEGIEVVTSADRLKAVTRPDAVVPGVDLLPGGAVARVIAILDLAAGVGALEHRVRVHRSAGEQREHQYQRTHGAVPQKVFRRRR